MLVHIYLQFSGEHLDPYNCSRYIFPSRVPVWTTLVITNGSLLDRRRGTRGVSLFCARSRGASPSLGARRCVVLQISSSREQTLVHAVVSFSPDRFSFLSFLIIILFFLMISSLAILRSQALWVPLFPPSLPLRSEPTPLRSSRNDPVLYPWPSLHARTATHAAGKSSPPCGARAG